MILYLHWFVPHFKMLSVTQTIWCHDWTIATNELEELWYEAIDGPILFAILEFTWKDWVKPRRASVNIAGFSSNFEPTAFRMQINVIDWMDFLAWIRTMIVACTQNYEGRKRMECVLYPATIRIFNGWRNQKECHITHEFKSRSILLCWYIIFWEI